MLSIPCISDECIRLLYQPYAQYQIRINSKGTEASRSSVFTVYLCLIVYIWLVAYTKRFGDAVLNPVTKLNNRRLTVKTQLYFIYIYIYIYIYSKRW